jgi:solute:Na+ symporter, SSS family
MKRLTVISVCLSLLAVPALAEGLLKWRGLPPLPPAPGQEKQAGLAGPFAGVHNGALVVAGGANFPDALPWRGGEKVWHDDAFVLEKDADGACAWVTDEALKLPRPLAYGVSVSTPEGIVCIGGCDANRCYTDVFLLTWDPATRKLSHKPMPPLPRPLAFMAGGLAGTTIYVAGGQEVMKDAAATKSFWALDLGKREDAAEFVWQELPAWPGPARVLPVAVGQSNGTLDCFYVFSGRDVAPGKETVPLTDAYSYNPTTGAWKRLTDITPKRDEVRCVMAGTGVAIDATGIAVVGGADGAKFMELEKLAKQIADTGEAKAATLKAKQAKMLDNHAGFSRDILIYDTVSDSWSLAGKFPTGSHVTTTAAWWDGAVVIPSGEVRPGVRTRKLWMGTPREPR